MDREGYVWGEDSIRFDAVFRGWVGSCMELAAGSIHTYYCLVHLFLWTWRRDFAGEF